MGPEHLASLAAAGAVDTIVLYAGAACARPADAGCVPVRTMAELQAWTEGAERGLQATDGARR